MTTPTKRQLRRELDDLGDDDGGDPEANDTAVSVGWRHADPDARPDGMEWSPSTDEADAQLIYDVWDAQRETLETVESGDYDVTAFLAGYGTGKSVLGARWLVAKAIEHPGSRFLCMGQDFQKAKNTTYPKLFAALPGDRTTLLTSGHNGPEHSPIVTDFNRQDYRLTLSNDSVIVLGSADDYARYAGAEFGGAWLDEPSHYGDVLHELTGMVTTRLRGVPGPKTQLWTLTGEGYNAAWEILEQRQDADGDPIGLDIDVIRASVLDNPYLTDGDKERFKRKYEGTAREQAALHGGFSAATGLVYSSFDRETHVIDHADAVDLVEDGWRVYGYDAGWNDPRVMIELGRSPAGQLVALGEYYRSETHVEDTITWLDGRPKGRIYAEHVPGEIERFRGAGYRVEKAEKDLDGGIAEVRNRLTVDGDRPGLLVSTECENLIREFVGYKEEQVGSSSATDHALDATRYAVMGETADGGGAATGMISLGGGGSSTSDDDADDSSPGGQSAHGGGLDAAASRIGSQRQKFGSGKW